MATKSAERKMSAPLDSHRLYDTFALNCMDMGSLHEARTDPGLANIDHFSAAGPGGAGYALHAASKTSVAGTIAFSDDPGIDAAAVSRSHMPLSHPLTVIAALRHGCRPSAFVRESLGGIHIRIGRRSQRGNRHRNYGSFEKTDFHYSISIHK
jgi:hypothetical protein